MDKTLKPYNIKQEPAESKSVLANKPKIIEAAPETRSDILKELPQKERIKAVESLVEYAMLEGLTEPLGIQVFLGIHRTNLNTITNARARIKQKWLAECGDISKHAQAERILHIKRAWDNVRECVSMYSQARSTGDKVKVKQLELQWLQYIAKLSFVEQMVESPETSGVSFTFYSKPNEQKK